MPLQLNAYLTSIEISLVTAIAGGIFGFLMAYAVISGGLPRRFRGGADDVLGRGIQLRRCPTRPGVHLHARPVGLLTTFLKDVGHRHVRQRVLALLEARSRDRLPVLPAAADDPDHRAGHRRAASRSGARRPRTSGASTFQFWRYVALPVLMPSLLGAMILLFGNSFGAQATAYQLTGGSINIVHDPDRPPADR